MIGYVILAAAVIFIAVVLIRAAAFKPKKQEARDPSPIDLPTEKIVSDMQDMLRCRTVSHRDHSLEEPEEFEKFRSLLKQRFPLIHKTAELHHIGRNGLLYIIKGSSSEKPSVCMAHYDVVPIDEEGWTKPAFEGLLEDGCIWGRGAIDTKATLCGVCQALELLLSKGYIPKNDLYLSFSGEEEIDGESCSEIVTWLEERGVTPAIVVDEGGAVVDKVFPGVSKSCALIGIGEKGGVNLDFSMHSQGGHASTPPVKTVAGGLARAIVKIEKHPFKFQLTKPVKEMFDVLGRESSFLFKVLFANLWCFRPVLDLYGRISGGELNAMLRTTTAVTRMQGSEAYNVLPPKASFGVNMRLLGADTVESVQKYLKKVIKNDKIEIKLVSGTGPSPYSDTSCAEWEKLKSAIRDTWPKAVVSPYLMMACSDSRNFNRISDRVYRFSAMHLSKEERAMIHGHNERIPVKTLLKTAEFYVRLLTQL